MEKVGQISFPKISGPGSVMSKYLQKFIGRAPVFFEMVNDKKLAKWHICIVFTLGAIPEVLQWTTQLNFLQIHPCGQMRFLALFIVVYAPRGVLFPHIFFVWLPWGLIFFVFSFGWLCLCSHHSDKRTSTHCSKSDWDSGRRVQKYDAGHLFFFIPSGWLFVAEVLKGGGAGGGRHCQRCPNSQSSGGSSISSKCTPEPPKMWLPLFDLAILNDGPKSTNFCCSVFSIGKFWGKAIG